MAFVEGLEPPASWSVATRSRPTELHERARLKTPRVHAGSATGGFRSRCLLVDNQALSQVSYGGIAAGAGLEPTTS